MAQVLLNILGQLLLLPTGEPSSCRREERRAIRVCLRELVRQRNAESLHIGGMGWPRILQLLLEFDSGRPDTGLVKEQPRSELDLGKAKLGIQQRTLRIDV